MGRVLFVCFIFLAGAGWAGGKGGGYNHLSGGGGVGGVGRVLGIVFLDLFRILCCFQPRHGSHVGGPNDITN